VAAGFRRPLDFFIKRSKADPKETTGEGAALPSLRATSKEGGMLGAQVDGVVRAGVVG